MVATRRSGFEQLWAVVPIRGLGTSKTRLGPDLDPQARRDLVERMLRQTLAATRDARSIRGTVVVTMDPAAAGIAHQHHAIGLVERAPGLNAAIDAARSLAVARGATAVLVLPADLPGISSSVVDDLVRATRGDGIDAEPEEGAALRLVGLVTDRHGRGTNALLLVPPSVIEPAFGDDSRMVHAAEAHDAGARWIELGGPLAFDVDTPEDLAVAEAQLGTAAR